MTGNNEELDGLLHNHWTLAPEQRAELIRRAMVRARAYRTEAIKGLFRWFVDWTIRRTAIARLQALDDRTLKDIGLDRSEIEQAVRGAQQVSERRKAA
jgi:uncharacterized protein YjiS (DUF1127 family)